jgi:FkbM family methyltransferase
VTPDAKAAGRSLRLYHAPGRAAALDGFYRRFLGPGDLAFDIGAHAGDRTASFRRLGATVVAVEPQPAMARLLRHLFARDPGVRRIAALVGAETGTATLWVNRRNPTVSTASPGFIAAADGAPGWEGQHWDDRLDLPATTLDALAAIHGRPHFIKIDIEGHEAEALRGLGTAPRALSFEFTTIQRDIAAACLERLAALGYRAFNASLGESLAFAHPAALDAAAIAAWLAALPHAANSGDIYAALEPGRLAA